MFDAVLFELVVPNASQLANATFEISGFVQAATTFDPLKQSTGSAVPSGLSPILSSIENKVSSYTSALVNSPSKSNSENQSKSTNVMSSSSRSKEEMSKSSGSITMSMNSTMSMSSGASMTATMMSSGATSMAASPSSSTQPSSATTLTGQAKAVASSVGLVVLMMLFVGGYTLA
ncbi:hypothetical protein OIO90_005898 [Microbotryomycetes sp. JL221]|nr:hypothetical protein OIO90_005898 [Microbotryomycetes sp. JL221]